VGHGYPGHAFPRTADAFGADGAAALYRRAALEDCTLPGGEVLDADMELWASDADLAWRAQLLGWRAVYEPGAVAEHIRTYSPSTRPGMSEHDRRLQFRNRYLMMVKNDSLRDLARDAGPLLLYEVLALGYAVLREPELLRGYAEALGRLPGALRRRRVIQARRRVERVPFGMQAPAVSELTARAETGTGVTP
jgi:GT2 family glycosyltransferase